MIGKDKEFFKEKQVFTQQQKLEEKMSSMGKL